MVESSRTLTILVLLASLALTGVTADNFQLCDDSQLQIIYDCNGKLHWIIYLMGPVLKAATERLQDAARQTNLGYPTEAVFVINLEDEKGIKTWHARTNQVLWRPSGIPYLDMAKLLEKDVVPHQENKDCTIPKTPPRLTISYRYTGGGFTSTDPICAWHLENYGGTGLKVEPK